MTAYRLWHLVSVGTSLVRNSLRVLETCAGGSQCPENLGPSEAAGLVEELRPCAMARPGSREDLECMERYQGWGRVHDVLLSIARRDPARMSAELNSMFPWLQAASRRGEFAAGVVLFPTETGPGLLAGRVLKRFIADMLGGAGVEMEPVPGWSENVWRGSLELYTRVVGRIRSITRKSEREIVLINATGGFKPETAYIVMAGLHYGDSRSAAYYIHELHRTHTVIPLLYPGSDRLSKAAEIVTRALRAIRQARRGRIRIEASMLEDKAGWLRWYAMAVEPLGWGRLLRDGSIELDVGIAEYISMLPPRS